MARRKTATIGIWLCIIAIALSIVDIVTGWQLPSGSDMTAMLLYLSYLAPSIIFLALRIVVFAKNKIRVLFPIVCVLEIIFMLRPTIQQISVNGLRMIYLPSAITQVALCTIPTIMLLVMAVRVGRRSPRLFYLPAIIYFVLAVTKMAFDYKDPFLVSFNFISYIDTILYTAIIFITGLFIKEE